MPEKKQSTLSENSCGIVKLYKTPKWKPELEKLLKKILRYVNISLDQSIEVIKKHLDSKNSDSKIINELASMVKKPEQLYSVEYDYKRAYNKWNNIRHHTTKKINSILDFGGNVGNTSFIIGRRILKLPKHKTFTADIPEWSGEKWVPRNDITFIDAKKLELIPDNSIDMITTFHVMHHIDSNDYKNIFGHFKRILTKDGFIVLYEHNCDNSNRAILIDIEHVLYDTVSSKTLSYNNFVKTHYAKYFGINKWRQIGETVGFKQFHIKELHNIDNSFYMFFKI